MPSEDYLKLLMFILILQKVNNEMNLIVLNFISNNLISGKLERMPGSCKRHECNCI